MKSLNKTDQMYDHIHSMHNMEISIMLLLGLNTGFVIYHFTNWWIAIPLCFFGGFVYPLGHNIWRRFKK